MEFEGFDRKALERELATAIDDEERRVRVDEMKKRAIGTARSYDEFRNLVLCANQKPVTPAEMSSLTAMKRQVQFNTASRAAAAAEDVSDAASAASATVRVEEAPATFADFEKVWRRHCPDHKSQFRCEPRQCPTLHPYSGAAGMKAGPMTPAAAARSLLTGLAPKKFRRMFRREADAERIMAFVDACAARCDTAQPKRVKRAVLLLAYLLCQQGASLALEFLRGEHAAGLRRVAAAGRDRAGVEAHETAPLAEAAEAVEARLARGPRRDGGPSEGSAAADGHDGSLDRFSSDEEGEA